MMAPAVKENIFIEVNINNHNQTDYKAERSFSADIQIVICKECLFRVQLTLEKWKRLFRPSTASLC